MNTPPLCTVLYVDDEPDLLVIGKAFLESTGDFAVDTQVSAEKALEILRTRSYDAIISDYQMPGMDGLVFLNAVRRQYGDLPFILFTGRGREAVVVEAINLGVDFYLQKGGDARAQFAELAHKIRMAVGRRKAEAALQERDAQLHALTNNLPSGMIYQMVMDPAGARRFLYVSPGVETLHGVKAGDVLADPSLLYDQIPPADRAALREAEDRAYATMSPFSFETRIRSASGTERWMLLRSAPRQAAEGRIIWDGIELDITATKGAEDKLRIAYEQLALSQGQLQAQFNALAETRNQIAESEVKYRTLVEHTADAVFIAQDGNLVFANSALALLTGYSLDEIVGLPFPHLIVPEDRDLVLGRHMSRINGGVLPKIYEFSLLHKDQATRIRVKIRVGAGTYHGRPAAIGTLHDVTEERKQKAELADSGELHRRMFAAIPDIIVRTDLEGKIIFINDKGVRLSGGRDPAELVGKSVFSFFSPESLPDAIENTRLMFERPLGPKEYTFLAFDGKQVFLEVNGDVLRTPEGIPYGMVYICRDISDRKQAEAGLRKSEEEFRNIVGNMQDIFYRIDGDGIITMITSNGARLLGYDDPGDICGKLPATRFFADPVDRDAFLAKVRQEKSVTRYPLTLKDREGNLHHVAASSRLFCDETGTIDGVEGTLHDITYLKNIEDALRQANRQIALMTSITRHDIRNQLMALEVYLGLSLLAVGDPARARELIAKEQQIASAIEQQINFTTVFDGMGEKAPVWQDPCLLMGIARTTLPFRDIRLDIPLAGFEIFADPLFEKVFYNIFDDALRYGGEGMTAIRADFRTNGSALTLIIEDDGVGIPDSDKARIFERGFGKNTGLGLFLVKEILAITGIAIRETGTPGRGARFEITVPKGAYRTTAVSVE